MDGKTAAEVVRLMGGQARAAQILDVVPRSELRAALRSGALVRVRRGRYAMPDLPTPWQTAQRLGGVLSHESAAQHRGWDLVAPPATVHVTVPFKARPSPMDGVTLHYADVDEQLGRPGVTTTLRTVLDCAATLPFVEALAVADSAVRAGLAPDKLIGAAEARKGRGRARMVRVARAADGRADNPFESALRATVLEAGLRDFEPQVVITARDEEYRVDLADRKRRLVLEADSHTFHTERAAFRRDCRRYDELHRAGWLVLRFAWEDVMFDQAWVGGLVRDVAVVSAERTVKVASRRRNKVLAGVSP